MFQFSILGFLFLTLCVGTFGQPPKSGPELIHLGDEVDVDVVGSLDFDWRGGLTAEGFLDGLVRAEKPVFALCRSERDVATAVAEEYGRVLRNPEVVVRIVNRSNRSPAYMIGAVKKPQRYQLRRPLTLAEMLVMAGGITDASNGKISIFRPPNVNCQTDGAPLTEADVAIRKPIQISVKIADLLSGSADADMQILSGDIVTVVESAPVFVTGDVAVPRRMNLTPDLSLLRSVAAAGGLTRDSDRLIARIHRRNGLKTLEFDLKNIEKNPDKDPPLEPYDVIEVEQKGAPARKLAPVFEPTETTAEARAKLPLRIVD